MRLSFKLLLAALLLITGTVFFLLTRAPSPGATWGGEALYAKAEKCLEALPTKEAAELRQLLTNDDDMRYEDRIGVWFKGALNPKLQPAVDYAMAELRAWSDRGDLTAMYALHYVLVQRVATADEGYALLRKAATLGEPLALFEITEHDLRAEPDRLLKAMTAFSLREDAAGSRALYWFAKAHKEGLCGLEKDATKSAEFRARAEALSEKLRPRRRSK
jgi:hypothetical protein